MNSFQTKSFIEQHIDGIVNFYEQHAQDPSGGFFRL